jgi:hypothetical protein
LIDGNGGKLIIFLERGNAPENIFSEKASEMKKGGDPKAEAI